MVWANKRKTMGSGNIKYRKIYFSFSLFNGARLEVTLLLQPVRHNPSIANRIVNYQVP